MSKQQTYPRGNAGSCLCGEELAFNKAQVYCWVGALSVGKPWEAESQFSVISILSPTSTWLLSEGSWHTSQEDFCLSFFSSSFTVCLASDPDSLTFCQLHFPSRFSGHHFDLSLYIFFLWRVPNCHWNVDLTTRAAKTFVLHLVSVWETSKSADWRLRTDSGGNVTKHIYSSTVVKHTFEELVVYLNTTIYFYS